MTNRLADSTSPYLLQHAENPVDWWPWSEEAFAEARRRDVPILLSVGYSACHWCHVMAHESFEDPDIAQLLNKHFVSIKVDREERPDVDAVYMEATQAMSGQGGWPMTCVLTPDGKPFHCGTYYPPTARPGMPSFRQLLAAVVEAWQTRREEIIEAGAQVVDALTQQQQRLPESTVDADLVAGAVVSLLGDYDRRRGGFGSAPKFPPSMVLEFLLRHHERTGSADALFMATHALEAMARGGIYDQLAGGFARYSVDADWVVPHFEKMLYDNALLLRCYAHLARRSESTLARRIATETAEFLLTSLRTPQGAFAAALDADTDGVEGLTYVWTPAQLVDVLGAEDGFWAAELFDVTEDGTFEQGSTRERRSSDERRSSSEHDSSGEHDSSSEQGSSTLQLRVDPTNTVRWESVRERLLAARASRPQPARDDKIVTGWNGLAITALAEAGVALGEPGWVDAAARAAEFLLETHLVDGRLRRTSRAGVVGTSAGVLEDYATLADGLLALHQATSEPRWLEAAVSLLDTALAHFADESTPGAFHDTADDAEQLIRRPSDPADNASPGGASALAGALLTASALAGVERADTYRAAAEQAVARAGLLIDRAPRFAGHWCTVAEAMLAGPIQVAVVGDPADTGFDALRAAAVAQAPGGAVVLAGAPDAPGAPLLADRPLLAGGAAAYVCRGYVCDRPVGSVDELVAALRRS